MSADATQVMAGIASSLATLRPNIPTVTRKGQPSSEPCSPLCGWTMADPCPCFVVSAADPETIDEFGSFETVSVEYKVIIEYVKPVVAGVTPRNDDDEIRQWRQDFRAAFYGSTIADVTQVWDINFKSGQTYTGDAGGSRAVSVSSELMSFTVNEDRPS